ncbi:hypothetical protein [Candidatus Thiosymbion oneisti]|uniref:hypothetical protein n=1 Tax=Candidatus Thiosymbion oneisti TaxID=589554 RepID=UPI000B7F85D4|nr:hypothetical protein [Candidatus Thiosymbion oneisti]
MEKNTKKTPKLLLILVVGWVPLYILARLISSSRISIGFFSDFLLVILVTLAFPILLILSIVVAGVSLFRWLTRRGRPHVATFLPLVIMLVFYFLPIHIPSRTEMAFYHHRDEFIELADPFVNEHQNADRLGCHLPESPLYESAVAGRTWPSGALVIEFIVADYSLPLVYISTDNPDDVRDTCSEGGVPIERLEPNWYVCRRDWN